MFVFYTVFINRLLKTGLMKVGILFSGGKDSVYTTAQALKEGHRVACLINLTSENTASYMFHSVNNHVVKMQAQALGIPLLNFPTKGEKEKELADLKNALSEAKKKFGIEMVGAGALASQYQYDRVEKIALGLELEVFAPLWRKDEEKLLRQIVAEGFKVMIVAVAAEGTTQKWLGAFIDDKKIDELVKLNKKYGSHIMGEGGEYESLVVDGPIFKKKLVVKSGEVVIEDKNTGYYQITDAAVLEK